MIKVFRPLVLFLWLIGVDIAFFGTSINISLFVSIFLAIAALINIKLYKIFSRYIIFLFVWFVILSLYLFILTIRSSLISENFNSYMLSLLVFYPIYALAILQIVQLYKFDMTVLIRDMVIGCFINSSIIILSVIDISLTGWIYNFIDLSAKQDKYVFGEAIFRRYSGLATSGFSFLSVLNSFVFAAGLFLMEIRKKFTLPLILMLTIIFVSNIWVGRSGLVLGTYFLILFFINLVLFDRRDFRFRSFAVTAIIFLSSAFIFYSVQLVGEQRLDYILSLLLFEGSGNLTALSILASEYFFLNFETFFSSLFGVPNFNSSGVSLISDVGVVNIINLMGIVGFIIVFLPYFLTMSFSSKNWYIKAIFFSFPFVVIALNLKDTYLYGYSPSHKFFLLWFIINIYLKNRHKNELQNHLRYSSI